MHNKNGILNHLLLNKVVGLLICCWFLLSLTQTLHFYFYFDQTFWDSIRWSTRDWLVWFVIFAAIYKLCDGRALFTGFSLLSLTCVLAIAILSGIAQTVIITSLDFIAGTASRPFWQDFMHFYSKRWLQYLFIFTIFWLLMLNHFFLTNTQNEEDSHSSSEPSEKQGTIKIHDGKKVHWLSITDVVSIESAGNYICFHTNKGQLISRSSLKAIQEEFSLVDLIRVNRSYIINKNAVDGVERISRSRVEISLTNNSKVSVGPTYWKAVKQQLAI